MPRLRLFAILCFDSQERREAPRLVYRLDTRGAGLYRRQPVTVPPVPCHLRFTRQRHPPRQVTLPPPYPFSRPAAQRVIEVPALHLWFAVLYPRVEHQAVLAVVVVVVGPLVVHPYHPFRDAVRLLRQPAVFIVAVDIVRIFRDAVIRPCRERAVRVQFRVRQPVSCRVRRIRDIDIQVRRRGVDARQPSRVAVTVLPALLRAADADYLPSLFNGLVKAMNAAPPESEEKLAVLRVMRMLEDKSGRNNEVVKQYMAKRWSEKFHGQRDIQAQLMSHLDYALAHTDWHAERQAGDGDAISRWTPYDKPVVSAQKELSKLPVYQRVYQSLKTRALGVLPADLNLRDQVGPTFDQVFTSADDNKLVVPQFLTRYGLQSYFVKQRDELVELTAMDSWVLNLTRSVKYSDADRAEIQRQLTEQYISDYTATWRAGMDNLNIRNFESIGQLTGALEQVISGDQPLQRALTVLRDNTQPGVFSEKLSAKEREEALAEPDYQLLTRLGHEFAPENSTLAVQKDKESTMQAVYQQLTELHRYLLAIQNAPVPGKSALKAVQLRLDQNSSDPIFATRQMAKTLPAPLNRWVGRLTDQAWHVVMVEAVHYMEVDWRDSVVKPFNEQLANNYPFNPRSAQDASLDAFERFFKPDGILDTFYQQNLKLFIDNDLSLEDGDNNVIIREDIIAQLETAQKIRDIFFSKQNGLGTSFAVETVSLSGNKRRSVLNLDGQLVDYSQGRNYTAHLVWPNNMREGNESKLTLIGTSGNAPRSISFSGPWAQFRLFGAGQLTGVQDGNFTVRFSVDGGAMTYRVHTDTEDNPFSGGLFSQFGLSDTLY
ncbi:IcmF-like protein [Escherichia coli]|nr:IcmF-like protein [Escherichia coli]